MRKKEISIRKKRFIKFYLCNNSYQRHCFILLFYLPSDVLLLYIIWLNKHSIHFNRCNSIFYGWFSFVSLALCAIAMHFIFNCIDYCLLISRYPLDGVVSWRAIYIFTPFVLLLFSSSLYWILFAYAHAHAWNARPMIIFSFWVFA